MILGMSLIPTQMVLETRTFSVVIRRKWFHLLATLLFGPVTLLMPQLMSLGYAVALCGLAVIENLRSDMLFLQSFYINFLDPSKDNPLLPVVSHIFLILGCAIPLWIAECDLIEFQQQKVLAQWGVLCLGVGDAAGAVIGSWYGKYRWGQNQRTMEGSLAMWISIFGISFMMFPKQNLLVLIISTTLTSLVEAFTSQMDNMVLPLVGSISFLVLT
jgi:dolichol kinase